MYRIPSISSCTHADLTPLSPSPCVISSSLAIVYSQYLDRYIVSPLKVDKKTLCLTILLFFPWMSYLFIPVTELNSFEGKSLFHLLLLVYLTCPTLASANNLTKRDCLQGHWFSTCDQIHWISFNLHIELLSNINAINLFTPPPSFLYLFLKAHLPGSAITLFWLFPFLCGS